MKMAVIGSAMMDAVAYAERIPAAGETCEAGDFHLACGGKGANQAVAAAKLGADVLFVASVGGDVFGRECRKNYEAYGLDTRFLQEAEGRPTGVAMILVEETGENRILISKGANEALTKMSLLEAEEEIGRCSLIVVQLEIPLETVYAAIEIGRRHRIPVLVNPAPAKAELSLERLCGCTFLMPNETELALLSGMTVACEDDAVRAAQKLLAYGVENVIVTMGARGSLRVFQAGSERVLGEVVRAVDTTGAGDAYIGCFAETWMRTGDVLAAMQRASRYAADSVTRRGTQDAYATREAFGS